ncbi:MAG TPA: NAD(P)H-dependent oxidoreductase, partial [Arachidicoccus sp.]
MEILDALKWRYATKKMNGAKVDEAIIDQILEATRLSPSSSGLQPYKILVITNDELKKQIQPIANNQSQVVDCSHLLVFAAWDNYTEQRINDRYAQITSERGLPADAMDAYKNRLISAYTTREANLNFEHAARQVYIALGIASVAAGELHIDTTPMEGFDNAALDKFLDLESKGLKSVVLLTVGYRDAENDWLVKLKKVREQKENF